ncbi:MAG: 4a-hydroxytetrahydrobiopterin dehydratase [Xenococcaceae cyanobacterium MO_167.B27]|nr:4a-hydroxytetrahydrobiopterin dehydratase [Xenococcaceae cyanobacterium MO_167.B27]
MLLTANLTIAQNIELNSMVLTQTQISEKIKILSDWTLNGKEITRTFQFSDFIAAIDFVNKLVEPAEAAGHHPDIDISYNKVTISLTTHDAGGLTDKDFALAETISQLAK